MQLGIFAKTFAGVTPAAVMQAARQAGFGIVQYNMACSGLESMPAEIADETARAVKIAAADQGIGIAAVSATYNMIHPDPAVRRRCHASLAAIAAAAPVMGTRLLTLCTGTRDAADQWRAHPDNNTQEAWNDLVESMATAIAIADVWDVDLGIEPELANVINSPAKARRLIDEMQSPRLKIILDPANLFEAEPLDQQRHIIAEGIELLADRIAMAHAKDRDAQGEFATAGTGVLDYDHYLACLAEVGFDGALVTHGLKAEEAPVVARFLAAKLSGLTA